MIAWWVAVAAMADPGCPDVEETLARLEHAASLANVAEGQAAAEEVVRGFSCSGLAPPEQVARLWIGQAAMMVALGADESADESLAAAFRLSPDTFPPTYGDALRERHAALGRTRRPGSGTITAFPVPKGYVPAVDGQRHTLPLEVSAGPHLVQIGSRRGPMVFAQVVTVPPDTDFVVETGLPFQLPRERRRRPVLLGVGLGVGVGALGLLAATIPTRNAAARAYEDEQFERGDAWVTVNHASLVSGLVALGLGGGLVVAARW